MRHQLSDWDDGERAIEIARKRGGPILRKREMARKGSWIKINGYKKKRLRSHSQQSLSNLPSSVCESLLNTHPPLVRQEEVVIAEPCNPSFPQ